MKGIFEGGVLEVLKRPLIAGALGVAFVVWFIAGYVAFRGADSEGDLPPQPTSSASVLPSPDPSQSIGAPAGSFPPPAADPTKSASSRPIGRAAPAPAPSTGFTFGCKDGELSVYHRESSVSTTCTVSLTGSAGHNASIFCGPPPASSYLKCETSPSDPFPDGNKQATSKVTITTAVGKTGVFMQEIRGGYAGQTKTFNIAVKVGDFTLSCTPTQFSGSNASPGPVGQSTCTVRSISHYSGSVEFITFGCDQGLSCSFSPAQVDLQPNGSETTTMTLSTTTGSDSKNFSVMARSRGQNSLGVTMRFERS